MPSSTPPPSAVLERFHHAAVRLLREMRSGEAAGGLSGPRASALSVLVLRGPQPLGELARAEGVKPPTMSRLVREMRIEGLVKILAPGFDRREVRVAPSARGRRVLMAARARRIRAMARLLRGARPGEVHALEAVSALLGRALGAARKLPPRRARGEKIAPRARRAAAPRKPVRRVTPRA